MSDPALIRDSTIIEAATRALAEAADLSSFWSDPPETRRVAAAVLAAVTPMIEAAALERAAKIVEAYTAHPEHAADVAARIRALKEQP